MAKLTQEMVEQWFSSPAWSFEGLQIMTAAAQQSKTAARISSEQASKFADSILSLIENNPEYIDQLAKSKGYVKLAADQKLPKKPERCLPKTSTQCRLRQTCGITTDSYYFRQGYEQAQEDMAGWRKVG